MFLAVIAAEPFTKKESLVSRMVENGWMKSIKAALLGGLVGLLGFVVEAKNVYYVTGYFGVPGQDAASFTVKDADGNSATYETGDTVIIGKYATVTEAWVSDDKWLPPLIKIEKDFTFHSGVAGEVLSGITVEIAENCTLTLNQGKSANVIKVGTVVFEGDGTIDLSGAASVSDPLTLHAGTKFKLPTNYTGGIVITDPENIDMSDYPDYVLSIDEDGVARLVKKDTVVAYVGDAAYSTLADAFSAAKPSGTIRLVGWPTSNLPAWTDSAQWQGTVQFSGTMLNGFAPANYGNENSTIEFKGVSGGYLVVGGSFAGALKVTNDGQTPGWSPKNGYSSDNFVFGALTGEGDIVAGDSSVTQQYSFKDASTFGGSMTTSSKRLVIGETTHGSDSQYTSRIYVEKGHVVRIAKGKTLSGKWGMVIDGTIVGSGTLDSPSNKIVVFKFAEDGEPTIDLSEGAPTIAANCMVTFYRTLTLKNVKNGDTILKCLFEPTNMENVKLKDENGVEKPFWKLSYTDGQVVFSDGTKKLNRAEQWTVTAAELSSVVGGEKVCLDLRDYLALDQSPVIFPAGTSAEEAQTFLNNLTVVAPVIRPNASLSVQDGALAISYEPMTLYWAAWRGTFWEHIGQTDVNGNHGLMRDEAGNINIAHRPNDTVIFDKAHYPTDDYWHYDENLYIKQQVLPGTSNEWDMKILEGVKLKLGFCGASASGQNLTQNFKIYVDEDSTLELGYWGNTHHKEGLLRENLTFGGAGTITLGDDMGASCRVEGDLKVKGDDVPTLNVRGKELVVQGGRIDVNLTGFGALSGSGTITTPITFNNATINATDANGFTFKNETTFTGTLTVDMTSAPTGEELVKICTKGEGGSFVFKEGIDVLVRVNGSVQPAFYTLATDNDGNLCVKVAPEQITYDAEVVLGYDYKTMICRVTMTPAIEGVVATVTVNGVDENLKTWTAPVIGMRGSGRCEVMVGNADDYFAPGAYSMTVSVGDWQRNLAFTLAAQNDGNLATVGGVGYKTMREAVAAGGTIKLLTNVFFSAPEGTYSIDRNGFDIKTTNYTTIDALMNEVTAEDEVVFTRGGEGITRVVIAGDWIAAGLPWKTKKMIDAAIWSNSAEMAPFEAYILGFDAQDALTAKVIARGVQTDDPDTIELSDGLTSKSAAQTGVVVTKKLVDADTKAEVSATTTYDLSTMGGKARLLKLSYDYAADVGQVEDGQE